MFRLPTSVVRSWADLFWSADPPVCVRSWTTTSSPSRNATAAIVTWLRRSRIAEEPRDGGPRHGCALPCPGAAGPPEPPDGEGDGTARDSLRLTEPANAGMSTASGSAQEIPIPKEPRRVLTNSWNPGEADRRENSSGGPMALTWYGPAR